MTRLPQRMSIALAVVGLGLGLGPFSACDDSSSTSGPATAAQPFADHECEACGMLVREQPAPRGQVVHRDGTRAFFCAISDMAAYLAAPSPHGDVTEIFVEVQPADATPADLSTEARQWKRAREATFVIGSFERRVMGRPVLSFASRAEAAAAATRLEGRALDWTALLPELDVSSEHAH